MLGSAPGPPLLPTTKIKPRRQEHSAVSHWPAVPMPLDPLLDLGGPLGKHHLQGTPSHRSCWEHSADAPSSLNGRPSS